MYYHQIQNLSVGNVISKGNKYYSYTGVCTGSLYIFTEVRKDDKEPDTVTLTASDLLEYKKVL